MLQLQLTGASIRLQLQRVHGSGLLLQGLSSKPTLRRLQLKQSWLLLLLLAIMGSSRRHSALLQGTGARKPPAMAKKTLLGTEDLQPRAMMCQHLM